MEKCSAALDKAGAKVDYDTQVRFPLGKPSDQPAFWVLGDNILRTLNEIFCYDGYKIYDLAEKVFIQACGFNIKTGRHKTMFAESVEILHKYKKSIDIKGIRMLCDSKVFKDNKIVIEGTGIGCNGFSKIKSEDIAGICFVVITAGDWKTQEGIKEQLYMDTWGTAFIDSARTDFEYELMKDLKDGQYLSNPFGPGYYGMPADDTKKFKRLLDLEKIGVEIRDSGIMIPEKTIASLYLVTSNKKALPPSSCAECLGITYGCKYCKNSY